MLVKLAAVLVLASLALIGAALVDDVDADADLEDLTRAERSRVALARVVDAAWRYVA